MKKLNIALSVSAIFAGIALTMLGLVHLSWPQALPWLDKYALSQFLVFMGVCAGLVVVGALWSKCNPLLVGLLIAVSLATISGALWPLLVTLWFAFVCAIIGKLILTILRIAVEDNWLTNFLVGAGFYGTAVGLLAHFPVNYPGVYGLALALPLVIWWRNALEYFRGFIALLAKKDGASCANKSLDVTIAVVALVYFVVALMPELAHDALAMHLFIPAHMEGGCRS